MTDDARHAAERVARESYGRLIALLAARSGDIAAAEDALADAFGAALSSWPVRGVPDRPEAWLLTAARRALGHRHRHGQVQSAALPLLTLIAEERADMAEAEFGDDRLKLMFVCAHPAIDPAVQAPLMLQTVLGIDAARIAGSFLVSPATMGQRLVRAKARIRDAGIAFAVPEAGHAAERLGAVLGAIYAAYGTGWDDGFGADAKTRGLAAEALWLARMVVRLSPDAAEAKGLLALILYCEARMEARRDAEGRFVPLKAQDVALWDRAMIVEAETLLTQAAAMRVAGRFQIEAAIQSHHVTRAGGGAWGSEPLVMLYDLLVRVAPSIGAEVARAVVYADAGRAVEALAMLDALTAPARDYQPWWAARAHVLAALARGNEAQDARQQAAGMTDDPAVRAFLLDH